MSRISAEKAVEAIGNRFDLVLVAAQRAREIRRGARTLVNSKNAGPTIAALQEIEEGKYTKQDYLNSIVRKRKY